MKRTNTCGQLTDKNVDKEVTLNGWCNSRRDHGGVIFIDLRDRYGLTQVTFDPQFNKDAHKKAEHLKREDVISITGIVKNRPKGMTNPKLKTGMVEVFVNDLEILNNAETPPIEIDDRIEPNEDIRLKYRYLDLRRPKMQNNIITRHKTIKAVRDYLDEQDFLEIETPILARSTPEGARDYLVPSRVNAGKFFALPQSPQIFKQLLMVSGFDRYFQIARCFRDEDLRADRQPEFTQIDMEMSFIGEEDIYRVMEGLMKYIWKEVLNIDIKTPFPRIPYEEAMNKYGSDKPDTRFGFELIDITEIAKKSEFSVFTKTIEDGGIVKCINAKDCAKFSRKDIDELTQFVAIYGSKGLAWAKMTDKLESSIVKFFNEDLQKELIKKTNAKDGDLLLFVANKKHFTVNDALGNLRVELAKRLNLLDDNVYNFTWITDFPLLEYDEEEQRHMAIHHPFTSPKDEDLKMLDKDPLKVKSKAYDLALNGTELGGGSIRIHRREIQEKIFSALGIGKKEAEDKFGFLLGAFRYGAPPHGGIAFGVDRMIALITKNESIREVIAFPKNKAAESLMDASPSNVDDKQLKELHIKLDMIIKKKNQVLKEIKESLMHNKKDYELMQHDAVFTSEQAAKARGTDIKQSAKTLIIKADSKFIMAIVSGAKEVDLDKLKKITKAKKIALANADEIKEITACSIGAVPPFGNLFNIDVYVDKSLTENDIIAFNAGSHTTSIKMECRDYIDLIRPKESDFSK